MAIKQFNVNSDTPIDKLLKFREKYSDELGQFRIKISELRQKANYNYEDVKAFEQSIEDIYKNEVLPSMNNLEKSLSGFKIKWFTENFLRVSLISTSSSALLTTLAAMTIPTALIAAAGLSVVASGILYSKEKEEKIRNNPFSYLLEVKRKLK